jgi:hypothetical protein
MCIILLVSDRQNQYYNFLTDNEHTVIACDEERNGRINTNKPNTFNSFESLGNYDNGGEKYQRNNYMPASMILDKTKGSNGCINSTNTRMPSHQTSVRKPIKQK